MNSTDNDIFTAKVVHVWWADLDNPCCKHIELKKYLSLDELKKAMSFKFPVDQQRFIAARGQLRMLLASYLKIEPANVQLTYSSYGKPQLASIHSSVKLEFNLSHCEGHALYAFANNFAIGIDLESEQRELDVEVLAENFFSTIEYRSLMSLSPILRCKAFLHAWTRKEAVVKALGLGLSFSLDKLTVTLNPDEPAQLVNIQGDQAKAWSLISLDLAPGWLAAVAFRQKGYNIFFRDLKIGSLS